MILSPDQSDAMTELVNIGMGKAAASLNDLVHAHVKLTVPQVFLLDFNSLLSNLHELREETLSTVQLVFTGAIEGSAILVFPPASALNLVTIMAHDESGPTDLDCIRAGTLTEVGNIVINGVIGTISNILKQPMKFSIPRYLEGGLVRILNRREPKFHNAVLLAKTLFQIEEFMVEGSILILFELKSFDSLLEALGKLLANIEIENRTL